MAFTEDVARAVAEARSRVPQAPRQGQVGWIPPARKGGWEPFAGGAAGLGYGVGTLVGSKIKEMQDARNPEMIQEKADALRSRLWSMEDQEQRKQFVATKEVQERLQYWKRYNPTLQLMDMGEVHADEKYSGLLDFPKLLETEEQKKLKAQSGLDYSETEASRRTEAEIRSEEQLGEKREAETADTRTVTGIREREEQRAQERHPLEQDLLRAQIEWYNAKRADILSEPMKEVKDPTVKQLLDQRIQFDDALNSQMKYQDMGQTPEAYAVKDIAHTQAMVTGASFVQVEGVGMVPRALQEPAMMAWVNKSLNEGFQAAFRNPNMDPAAAEQLYRDADALFSGTYGFWMSPQVQQAVPEAGAFIDPNMAAKLAFIEYVATKDRMTPEQRKQARDRLAGTLSDEFMDSLFPGDKPGVWSRVKSFFSDRTENIEEEALLGP